jgi:uncharacterized membrane protein
MGRIKTHVTNKLVAGTLAAIPVAVTAFILWYLDSQVRHLVPRLEYPFVGVAATFVAAVIVVYALGLFVTSLVGRYLLSATDWLLERLPGFRALYTTWKQIALTPSGGEGIFTHVVLLPDESGRLLMLGFTSGQGIPGDEDVLCVYVPGSPNPTTGKLYFVPRERCRVLPVGAKDALKFVVSGGNYVPVGIARAVPSASRSLTPPPAARG